MGDKGIAIAAPSDPITLDDLRHKALTIRQDVKAELEVQVSSRRNQIIVAGILVVVVGFGVAYFLGSRAGRAAAETAVE
jgi:hypothetical protein